MAGSIDYRQYVSDNGGIYAIKIDKSNASAIVTGGAGALCPVRTADVPLLPRNIKKRYVLAYESTNPLIRRKFYVGDVGLTVPVTKVGATITAEDYPGAGDTAGASKTFVITAYRGERQNLPPSYTAVDTGLNDGIIPE